MVGVPGKYKGCETCRLRRVKCDNTRPFCRKCLDGGRECAGYERETVFIIGTLEDGGRCSSHPPRVVKSKKAKAAEAATAKKASAGASSSSASASASTSSAARTSKSSSSRAKESGKLKLVPVRPLQSAWDDLIALTDPRTATTYLVRIAALHTNLGTIIRQRDEEGDDNTSGKFSMVSLEPYSPADVRPFMREEDFELRSQCIVHLSPLDGDDGQDDEPGMASADSICLFLYEQNSSTAFSNRPPWRDPSIQANSVRQLGPARFKEFPSHHFFVRVYRPNAICAALLNRRNTFLSAPEWVTVPWESHPKSWFDRLLDIIVLLPGLFARADQIVPHNPTLARRLMAQDLLANCLSIERQLEGWYASVTSAAAGAATVGAGLATSLAAAAGTGVEAEPPYWMQDAGGGETSGGVGGDETMAGMGMSMSAMNMGMGLEMGMGMGMGMGVNMNMNMGSIHGHSHGGHSSSVGSSSAQIPFADTPETFAFRDLAMALTFVYYWTALVLLYPCIERVHAAVFQPVADAFPHIYPSAASLPAALRQVDPQRYGAKEVRELAARVCRALDSALGGAGADTETDAGADAAVQPDLLVAPLFAIEEFYRDISNTASGDGALEIMWCDAFRARLAARGQDIADVVQGRLWADLGRF